MPPKKVVELKQIVPIYEAENLDPFWKYQDFSSQEQEKVNNFFKEFHEEIKAILTDNLFQNMQKISSSMGHLLHHYFNKTHIVHEHQELDMNQIFDKEKGVQMERKQSVLQSDLKPKNEANKKHENQDRVSMLQGTENIEKETEQTVKKPREEIVEALPYCIINNRKLDWLTVRSLIFQMDHSNVTSLKFMNNSLEADIIQLLEELFANQQSAKITKFFFDWNPLQEIPARESFFTSLMKSQTLELVTLRSNNLSDDLTIKICETLLEAENSNIKFLDLYDNNIGLEGLNAIGNLIHKSRTLEHIGLAQNKIQEPSDLNTIFNAIGKYPIAEEDIEAHREKEKERDAVIERNKKKKQKRSR